MTIANTAAVVNQDEQKRCDVLTDISDKCKQMSESLAWLKEHMHPYFFVSMQNEQDALATLAYGLAGMRNNRRMILADREKTLILASLSKPGSLYENLQITSNKQISLAEFTDSKVKLPGTEQYLEIHKYEFDRKKHSEIANATPPRIPAEVKKRVAAALKQYYPDFDTSQKERLLTLLWLNNRSYVMDSPARRVAKTLWLHQQTVKHDGVFVDLEIPEPSEGLENEVRLFFGVANPPEKNFLSQVMEIFKRLKVSVERAYGLTLSNGTHPYFLSTFYVTSSDRSRIEKGSELYSSLKEELYNTQILRSCSQTYREMVPTGLASGTDASLLCAFIGFCHTNMAHNHPDSYDLEGVMRAFHNHPDIALQMVRLFRVRFDPLQQDREEEYARLLTETEALIEQYNTGRRFLDDFRRRIFNCALLFVRHTLKTNFFVPEKHALSFRLDPAYLDQLGSDFISDLPLERPFRVTYFYGRYGSGYHIGFSDIARGGWRTLITQGRDEYVTAANTLFKENYVLAHTQHLKNKDIYEGGSKMVAVLDAGGNLDKELLVPRLYKLQFGFINAFLDIYVTENGRAKDPRVIDYYGEDEPIELGPDENMHDSMIELIARQAVRRGYLLGSGIMSSKKVGINHKEYGVTSTGVVRFAEVAMKKHGIDMHKDSFTVKLTGGPNGDVAGNAMQLLLERCPQVKICLIIDGTGAFYDPQGAEHQALADIVLKSDLEAYDPRALHPGGFILYRNQTRQDGLRKLFKKMVCTEEGVDEQWVTNDEFYREYNRLIFNVSTDLFIPAGGRPETLDINNCEHFFDRSGNPSAKIIVEGANSFITPDARIELQQRGVIILRDASANKCGVISSSYEIIANLMMTEKEFLLHKKQYVADVIDILNRRAEDEAELIFRRIRNSPDQLYTEVSDALSREINDHYSRLFNFFQNNPQLCEKPLYRKAILLHMPRLIGRLGKFRRRIDNLPDKIKYAILASEIASSMVYKSNEETTYMEMVEGHLEQMAPL
ncbi:MAG: NAD-glutamate dehydrogenase [Desulfuromonadales bacterium]|nr:NAD-glutamate dehydrogenase [Desulfuromonadales bacterium]